MDRKPRLWQIVKNRNRRISGKPESPAEFMNGSYLALALDFLLDFDLALLDFAFGAALDASGVD